MERFTQAINRSVESENWYSALALALTIPDICGRLSYPDLIKKSQERYKKWFDEYIIRHYESPFHGEGFTFMSGGDCYALRCALLHEGRDDVTSQKTRRDVISKITFSTTGPHRCMIDGLLVLNLQAFCHEINQGVIAWNEDFKYDTNVQAAVAELLTIQTQGFYPMPGLFIK